MTHSLLDYVEVDGVGHLLPYEELSLWEDKVMFHKPDPDWIWVYRKKGEIKAALVCAPVHGIILLLRLRSFAGAPRSAVLSLLRACSRECRERGYVAFIVWACPENVLERHLLAITRRFGVIVEETYKLGAGKIPERL